MSISAKDFIALFKFDFTPRWICMYYGGRIGVSDTKPRYIPATENTPDAIHQPGKYVTLPPADIAEFQNKTWQGCIFEIKQPENPENWVGCLCVFDANTNLNKYEQIGV